MATSTLNSRPYKKTYTGVASSRLFHSDVVPAAPQTDTWSTRQNVTVDTYSTEPGIMLVTSRSQRFTLTPDDPIWLQVEAMLHRLWATLPAIDPAEDDAWLDELRSRSNERLEDLYDGFEGWH